MKTVHIESYNQVLPDKTVLDYTAQRTLMQALYDYTLKHDPLFHFRYQPELVIRISSALCLKRVREYLSRTGIQFREYDYPFPEPAERNFGEEQDSLVGQRQDIFLPLLHTHSIAALTLDKDELFQYFERLIETAFNAAGYPHEWEGLYLTDLAVMTIGAEKVHLRVETHQADQ